MSRTFSFLVAAALLLATAPAGAASPEQGWFGIRYTVETESLLSTTIESVTIAMVRPDSAAAEQHLAAGDEVVEVENHRVAGSKVRVLRALMSKPVGGILHLQLKRLTGDTYEVALVAATKPTSP